MNSTGNGPISSVNASDNTVDCTAEDNGVDMEEAASTDALLFADKECDR